MTAEPVPATTAAVPGRVDVLVVGCGPVGLVAAGLLGAEGVTTLVVERNPATSDEAKAISIDDESLRTLQRAGLASVVYPILQPGTGTRYHGADGSVLVHSRGRQPYRLGHPFKSSFAQPDLERVLLSAVTGSESVRVALSTELVGLSPGATAGPDGGHVECTLRSGDGSRTSVRASYVLGCDGGRSTVRKLAGIEMDGRAFAEDWLVADTVGDPHRERYGLHHGDPARPHVIIPGRDGRCRYEFKLSASECRPGAPPLEDLAVGLIGRYRSIAREDIERCTAYRFNALIARRWRRGRVLLAGDAAHMMPPFAGQGLNSGIRDVDNLCWKLAAVVQGRASPGLLDTYEQERRPHARAMIRLSVRLGRVVMTSNRAVAGLRDRAVRGARRVAPARRWLEEMRFKPAAVHRRGFVAAADGCPDRAVSAAVGRMLPQPRVLDAQGRLTLLDDVLGPGFALLAVDCPDDAWTAADLSGLAGLDCRWVDVTLDDTMAVDAPAGPGSPRRAGVADADGCLQQVMAPLRGRMLLVRPDRYVAAGAHPDRLGPVLAVLGRDLLLPEAVRPARQAAGAASGSRLDLPRPPMTTGAP
ncbi:MAG TPA: bifunctional 3-(3-hydroxy-phenyl)propionate/3-hydroxycinnamic acid hydroxylase [Acidimicrobiales bacterium]|nr:bifunctional 3-(3-hydroxy-phenyl)propionate/3-hydroxycinnamic acid hydroxylase [Acidimicrobiales bacterium]